MPAARTLVRVTALDPSPPGGQYLDQEVGTVVADLDGRFTLTLVLNPTLSKLAAFHMAPGGAALAG